MILDSLFNNKQNTMLKKMLEFSSFNHKVIANNIANVETPGFTAKKVVFEEAFSEAVKSGDPSRISEVVPVVKNNYENPYRMDMNNVDIEKELLALEENRLRYVMTGDLLKSKLTKWKKIIEGLK